MSSFDPLVHLCRGDIVYHPHVATVIIKWSKTLQSSSQFATIQIPVLGSLHLCPVAALLRLINKFPLPPMLPSLPSPKASPSQSSPRAKSGRPFLPSSPHLALTPPLIPSMPSGGQGVIGLQLRCIPTSHPTPRDMVL